MITQKFGKYQIISYLGGGRFGDVYLVKDTLLDAEFALKISRSKSNGASLFLHEIKTLFTLEHPNIIRYYSAEIIEGKLALITEYVKGMVLRKFIEKKTPAPPKIAKNILISVADALDFAHKKKIIHRDLKPENIILTKNNKPKLMDFGLAKFLDKEITQSIGGTPPYMPPEAWLGKIYKPTDQWALAVIMLELLTGVNPFFSSNLEGIRKKVFKGLNINNPLLKDMPKNMIDALLIALSPKPSKRFISCSQFIKKAFDFKKAKKSFDSVTIPPILSSDIKRITSLPLTKEQKEAILSLHKHVLLVGGAGTGKTYTLVAKVHNLIFSKKVNPMNILISTYTVRGWQDVEERLEKCLKLKTKDLWIGNFHRHCYYILSAQAEKIGYKDGFSIIDPPSSLDLIKKIEEDKIIAERPSLREIKSALSKLKLKLLNPQNFKPINYWEEYLKQIWEEYQKYLKKLNLIDHDDIIIKTYELLKKNPNIRLQYQDLFSHILIDEFQDFDLPLLNIVKLLVASENNLFCTGDDDQNIYGWKSGDYNSPHKMYSYFDDFAVYNLTKTFRLPQEIISPALNLISQNKIRIKKVIWTNRSKGEGLFSIKSFPTPTEEASFVAVTIKKLVDWENYKWKDFSVLSRFNRHLYLYRKVFKKMKIPFSFEKGESFYEKEEILLLIKFLKAISSQRTKTDISHIEKCSNKDNVFVKAFLNEISERKDSITAFKALKLGIEKLGLLKGFKDENHPKSSVDYQKMDGVFTFMEIVRDFEERSKEKSTEDFLNYLKILKDSGLKKEEEDVKLLTIHQAKGLEFPVVFMIGLVEGEFPFVRSLIKKSALEEERRICYVGMTRATEKLYLTYSNYRESYKSHLTRPSRFLREMIGA